MLGQINNLVNDITSGAENLRSIGKDVLKDISQPSINHIMPENEAQIKLYVIIGPTPELQMQFLTSPRPDVIACITPLGTDNPADVNCKDIKRIGSGTLPLSRHWLAIYRGGQVADYGPSPPT